MSGKLYIVSTPIGHLSDITLRAIDILKSVDFIAAEDTRHSAKLLLQYQINTPVFSLHEHNEDERIEKIMHLLNSEKSVALISDAGTPLISDPGFRLVRALRFAHYAVIAVPGACAAIAALSISGLPTDKFIFEGFLPAKNTALIKRCETLKNETRTLIFYESVHRIENTLSAMKTVFGDDRLICVARELTKQFETVLCDTLKNICALIKNHPDKIKGEFVLILQGAIEAKKSDDAELEKLLTILLSELSVKQAVSLACKISGDNRKKVYAMALSLV